MRKADQAKIRQRKNIAFRMNVLFFSIFLLFSVLILRLGYLQIVKGEEYVKQLEKTEEIAVNTSVPRGRIYDRTGRILVDNEPKNAITYTKKSSTKTKEMLETAERLVELIEPKTDRITLGDKRDFWILLHPEEAAAKVPEDEVTALKADESLNDKDVQRKINQLTRERITEEDLNELTEHDLKVLAVYREMSSGYAYTPQIVKSDGVTDEEFAAVSERLGEKLLEGVNTTTDWDRVKLSDSAILGSTSTPIEGIPRTHLDYYLARDYARNDRVGKSYFEGYYEDLLKGQKTIMKNIKDRTGRVIETKTVREGEPGKDLVLTIDSELSEQLEELVSNELLKMKRLPGAQHLEDAFLIMMDPNNGEVLSLVGKKVVKNEETGKLEVRDYTFGTFTAAFEAGSAIKLATVLTGYSEGVLNVGDVKIDEALNVGGTWKRSLFNRHGGRYRLTDVEAIGRSSNVYMFRISFGLANANYRFGQPLRIDVSAFDKFRENFASFGLGVKTGIDLPNEYAGVTGTETIPGKLMDFSIGQFDTYTPLQLAQYVSTIANGGYRVAPKVLKEIREPSFDGEYLGPLLEETKTSVLNRINNTDREIEQVKKGMRYTYYGKGGTISGIFDGASYDAAGKTGTAQSFHYPGGGKKPTPTVNITHVGFAPADNPEVAYAVVIPHVSTNMNKYPSTKDLVRGSLDIYFNLKNSRASAGVDSTALEQILPPLDEEQLQALKANIGKKDEEQTEQ